MPEAAGPRDKPCTYYAPGGARKLTRTLARRGQELGDRKPGWCLAICTIKAQLIEYKQIYCIDRGGSVRMAGENACPPFRSASPPVAPWRGRQPVPEPVSDESA